MSRRARTLLAVVLASGLVGGLVGIARAVCTDTPLTVTFDAGAGTPHCYTEAGMTVCAFDVVSNVSSDAALALGDNDGDTSPDLMNYNTGSGDVVYSFSMGGAPFAVTGFDFVYSSGDHVFDSSKGSFDLTASGPVTPDPAEWSGITSFTWTASFTDSIGAVMDNLDIIAQCCGNSVIDPGEQCDDGNTVDGDCCSATCQFDASGSSCDAAGDGNICTSELCDGAGTCTHPPLPNCDVTRPCGPAQPPGNPAFAHPKKASGLKVTLVQAFVVCGDVGGNSPTTTTEGGIPACAPQTPNERAGSPANGWKWDPNKGKGELHIKPTCGNAADAAVKLKLAGIVDGTGAPANGQGSLALAMRTTLDDPVSGDMTTVDLSGQLPVSLVNGTGALKTTVGVILSESGIPQLPNGSSIELEEMQVRDPNGNLFADPGLFLP